MGAHGREKLSWALIGESLSLSFPFFSFCTGLWLAALTALRHGGACHVTHATAGTVDVSFSQTFAVSPDLYLSPPNLGTA